MIRRSLTDNLRDNFSQELEIRDIYRIFLRNRRIILYLIFIFSFIFAMIGISRKKIYEGTQFVIVNENSNNQQLFIKKLIIENSKPEDILKNSNKLIKYCQKSYSPIDIYQVIINKDLSQDIDVELVKDSNLIQLKIKGDSKEKVSKDIDLVVDNSRKTFLHIFEKCKKNKLNQFLLDKDKLKMQNSSDTKDALIKEIDKKIYYLNEESFDNNIIEVIPFKNIKLVGKSNLKTIFIRSLLFSILISLIIIFLKEFNSDYIYDIKVLKYYIKYDFLGFLDINQKSKNRDILLSNKYIKEIIDNNINLKILYINKYNNQNDNIFDFDRPYQNIFSKDIHQINNNDKLIIIVNSENLRENDLMDSMNQLRNREDIILGWFII